jgi:type II secretory pathway pseudopilin PulG
MNWSGTDANPPRANPPGLMRALPNRAGRRRARLAFTFPEVLAAMVFLAILVPVVIEGLTLANRAATVADRTAIAAQLGENRLNELMFDRLWATAPARGDFGSDWAGYRYELIRGNWPADRMVELTVRVTFEVQGRQHEVRLTTLVDDSV